MNDVVSWTITIVMALVFIIIGIWGLISFDGFMNFYIKFMDRRNTLNIKYPKGSYARLVMRSTLTICLAIGVIILSLSMLNVFGVISVE